MSACELHAQHSRFADFRRRIATLSAIVALLLLTGMVSRFSLKALSDPVAWRSAGQLLAGLLAPELEGAFLERLAQLLLESVAIATLGLALALVLGIPLAIVAARPSPSAILLPGDRTPSWQRLVGHAARLILALWRSVPEIIWAYLFVRMLGLGAGPAVLAIGLTFAGIIGKLYAELIENCEPSTLHALRAAGAGTWGVFLQGVLPQIRSQWVGYALYRFECAIRSAAILGVVGAGGIGSEIELSMRYFEWHRLASSLWLLFACMALIEAASALMRRRAGTPLLALAIAALGAVWLLDIPWFELLSPESLEQAGQFASAMLAPNFDWATLSRALTSMAETVAMAAFATLLAAIAALWLAPFARRNALPEGRRLGKRPAGLQRLATSLRRTLAKGTFLGFRGLPELLWALLFVLLVGPGPFAGVLAIAAHTFGVLGRLFGEAYEDSEAASSLVLEAAGCSPFARWLHGTLPASMPRVATFGFYRFEVNVRATAMIGFVGAGGIGNHIHTAISLFHFGDLATLLLVLIGAVMLLDALSHTIRMRYLKTF